MSLYSDFVMTSRRDGDNYVVKFTAFYGNSQTDVSLAAQLLKAGHQLTQAEGPIPGLWHIDGGPELTTWQMRSVARDLLDKANL